MTISRPRVLFIVGSINQTTQLHQISQHLPEAEAWFSPYYGDRALQIGRHLGLLENTIGGNKLRNRAIGYLRARCLRLDDGGRRGPYDLVVTCSDVVIPSNIRSSRIVAVQEGILDPRGPFWPIVQRWPERVPRWLCGTAATGLSGAYDRFCVASAGYRDLFAANGAPRDRLVVTGIPNFDDLAARRVSDFPYRDYVLACTSDARETFKFENRRRVIERVVRIAAGRRIIFKLHPNENAARAEREIARWAKGALVFQMGDTNAMIANASVLVTQYSSVAFVGLALGKETHSYWPLAELRRLLPEQNGRAAQNIAAVCRELLFGSRPLSARSTSEDLKCTLLS